MVDVVFRLDLSYERNDKRDEKEQPADQGDALDGRHGNLGLGVLRRVRRLAVRHYADDVRYGADDEDDKADEKDEVEKFVTRGNFRQVPVMNLSNAANAKISRENKQHELKIYLRKDKT